VTPAAENSIDSSDSAATPDSVEGGRATIVIADRRPSSRAATGDALGRHGFETLAHAGSADEAVALSVEHQPQAVLLDVDLPGDPIEAIEEIRQEVPRARIAVLTGSQAEGDVVRTIRAGADGYILKTNAPDRIAAALRALIRGEIVLPRALTSALVAELRKSPGPERSRRRLLQGRRPRP
jgi:NarL family two-component system response regulator LiaR